MIGHDIFYARTESFLDVASVFPSPPSLCHWMRACMEGWGIRGTFGRAPQNNGGKGRRGLACIIYMGLLLV